MVRLLKSLLARHETFKVYTDKVERDNIYFLVSAVAWNLLMAVVPLAIGMLALVSLVFRSPSQQRVILRELSHAFQGVLGPGYLEKLVRLTVHHGGLTAVIGVASIAWAALQVGFALSDAFEALFEVRSRPFLEEKLIHVGMFFVFVVLMLVMVAAATARSTLRPILPGWAELAVTTAVSFGAAFVLFAVIYVAYPNTNSRLKLEHVWQGALLAAILFQVLTYVWPLYVAMLSQYGGILVPILVLTLWIYFFSLILIVGAEFVAIRAIHQSMEQGEEVGPAPDGTVPQHETMRRRPHPRPRSPEMPVPQEGRQSRG
ncbi:MAG: YihY/virulence factor BrkB family protein [Chloroflexi bacterium]|nr:YihY/virulence factor BrkB family protein [Chloroflexota bacterium]